MKCAILLLTVILASCAKQRFSGNEPSDEIRPFVESFYSAYAGPELDILYMFIPLEEKAAECVTGDGGVRIINVNSEVWDDLCLYQKKAVVWHELGHCVLGRAHVTQYDMSYMRPQLSSCEFYEENEETLDEEMFSP